MHASVILFCCTNPSSCNGPAYNVRSTCCGCIAITSANRDLCCHAAPATTGTHFFCHSAALSDCTALLPHCHHLRLHSPFTTLLSSPAAYMPFAALPRLLLHIAFWPQCWQWYRCNTHIAAFATSYCDPLYQCRRAHPL